MTYNLKKLRIIALVALSLASFSLSTPNGAFAYPKVVSIYKMNSISMDKTVVDTSKGPVDYTVVYNFSQSDGYLSSGNVPNPICNMPDRGLKVELLESNLSSISYGTFELKCKYSILQDNTSLIANFSIVEKGSCFVPSYASSTLEISEKDAFNQVSSLKVPFALVLQGLSSTPSLGACSPDGIQGMVVGKPWYAPLVVNPPATYAAHTFPKSGNYQITFQSKYQSLSPVVKFNKSKSMASITCNDPNVDKLNTKVSYKFYFGSLMYGSVGSIVKTIQLKYNNSYKGKNIEVGCLSFYTIEKSTIGYYESKLTKFAVPK